MEFNDAAKGELVIVLSFIASMTAAIMACVLKSRCTHIKMGCISCERIPLPVITSTAV